MVRLIQKSGYIKSDGAGGYMKYIGTRERVEKLGGSGPATESQRLFIENLLQDFPDAKDLDKYKNYHAAPTSGSASTLISATLDANAHEVVGREGYMKYIATRPRVERHGEHGLFSNRPRKPKPLRRLYHVLFSTSTRMASFSASASLGTQMSSPRHNFS